jgi:hypothetical protein
MQMLPFSPRRPLSTRVHRADPQVFDAPDALTSLAWQWVRGTELVGQSLSRHWAAAAARLPNVMLTGWRWRPAGTGFALDAHDGADIVPRQVAAVGEGPHNVLLERG